MSFNKTQRKFDNYHNPVLDSVENGVKQKERMPIAAIYNNRNMSVLNEVRPNTTNLYSVLNGV